MVRQGLNCTLSYMRNGKRQAYQVRANVLTHGTQVIYEESASRARRAFYPHRLSSAKFSLGIEVVGEDEYTSFTSWMADYAAYLLDLNLPFGEFPAMTVSLPVRNFLKKGVPLSGYEWSAAVGKMTWALGVVFETSEEPADQGRSVATSYATGIAMDDPVTKFFYPTGSQLSGEDAPPSGTYANPFDTESLAAMISAATASDSLSSTSGAGSSAAADRIWE